MTRPTIAVRKLADLTKDPRNARTHSEEQIAQIAGLIRRYGWTAPAMIVDSVVYAGNGRYDAAALIYAAGERIYMAPGEVHGGALLPPGTMPTIDCTGWGEDERKAFALADNQIALNAGWDEDALRLSLQELEITGFDLGVVGFDADALAGLFDDGSSAGDAPPAKAGGTMAAEFLIPPFTVLNAREGWWQARKKEWIALGIRSEVGRGENLISRSLHDRLCLIVPGAYQAASDFIAAARADGLDDEAIWAKAIAKHGTPKGFLAESMAAGVGTRRESTGESVYLKGSLNLEITTDPYRKRQSNGRAKAAPMGQDLLKGEGKFGVGDQAGKIDGGLTWGTTRQQYSGVGGNLPGVRKPDTRATQTQDWVARKIEAGEIDGGMAAGQSGTSIFDPVLCELAYRWFSPIGGTVLDPFAGGSVRGIVCAALGRAYVGVDLRQEQVDANRQQWPDVAAAIGTAGLPEPVWHCGDSLTTVPDLDVDADMIFSCPPYGDLEVYSDDPADISTYDAAAFDRAYAGIIAAAVAKLRQDRFACFVVGDYRDRKGIYANFVSKTIAAFEAAGAPLYNEAILVTSVGSLPIRAAKQFRSTRKLGKTHQNVLVFVKGDPKKATAACGPVDVTDALATVEVDDDAESVAAQDAD